MANWDSTTLKCSNTEAVKACAAAIRDSHCNRGAPWKEGDTEFYASTRNGIPNDEIKGVSRQFPDDIITADYCFECDCFSEIHKVEYSNGEEIVVDIKPNYMYNPISLDNEKDYEAIYEKAAAFCRKLDTKEKKEDGTLSINWFNEEVIYKFEHDGEDGKKYRVEATKRDCQIDFKVFEGIATYDWREITGKETKT